MHVCLSAQSLCIISCVFLKVIETKIFVAFCLFHMKSTGIQNKRKKKH